MKDCEECQRNELIQRKNEQRNSYLVERVKELEAQLVEARDAVLEEAAQACLRGDNEYKNGIQCAKEIRKLKEKK